MRSLHQQIALFVTKHAHTPAYTHTHTKLCDKRQCPGGLSNCFTSTIGVKQGCTLLPTLFGIYIDEITDFIVDKGGNSDVLGSTQVNLLLYAGDIVLLPKFEHDLERHLNPLDDICTQRGLVVNLGRTKVLIFHTYARVRTKCQLTLSHRLVEVVRLYIYIYIYTHTHTHIYWSHFQCSLK